MCVGLLAGTAMLGGCAAGTAREAPQTTADADHDARMAWWREARFGMFIHWGLYAIPAGRWGDKDTYGEWIRDSAQIPLEQYATFARQFNPVKFDAEEWARLAKDAGMGYMVITTKHHDGFALFHSDVSEFDTASTPFGRDVMKELSQACAGQGLGMGWYYSIMDWNHPDYVPRRPWEKADRPADGAEFDRYVDYMKAQLNELLTRYGPIGVLWFDGQWEGTWTNERGRDLERFVRSRQPNVIINSRVGRAGGTYGIDLGAGRIGDYGTPEQFIPETPPGIDWETCMTMNGHWGYNAADKNFKSTTDLVRKLCDIASKDGNFLLNVGPTAEGLIPEESVVRLREIGTWMRTNGEAIRGTRGTALAAPSWGRVTHKRNADGSSRLYLHVFEWPANGRLVLGGLTNAPKGRPVVLGSQTTRAVAVRTKEGIVLEALGAMPADSAVGGVGVIALDLDGPIDPTSPPTIAHEGDLFLGGTTVEIGSDRVGVQVRYTLDGSEPTERSPVAAGPVPISASTTIKAACFREGERVSPVATRRLEAGVLRPADRADAGNLRPGLASAYMTGDFKVVPVFEGERVVLRGEAAKVGLGKPPTDDRYALELRGYLRVPKDGVYTLRLASDDGSRMWLGDDNLIDNDGLHSLQEKSAQVTLAAGLHRIRVAMFEATGGAEFRLSWSGPGVTTGEIPGEAFFHLPVAR